MNNTPSTPKSGDASSHGFSLVELLIVIVILGIWAAVVVFTVGRTTSNAGAQACKTEAKQFLNGFVGYEANHGGQTVPGVDTATRGSNLYADKVLSSGTFEFLSSTQGGPATGTPSWTFNATTTVVVTNCG